MEICPESRTALSAASIRAYHCANDISKIFHDPIAHKLVTAAEESFFKAIRIERLKRLVPSLVGTCSNESEAIKTFMRVAADPAEMLSRARYAEDKLEEAIEQGIGQYVLLGAGMDSFVFRRTDLNVKLQVFEVDRPSVLAFKQQRLKDIGLDLPENLHFVPVDFAKENIDSALSHSAYNEEKPAFFSWLGVTPYLDHSMFNTTLQALTRIASSQSQIVFDFLDIDAFDDKKASAPIQELVTHLRRLEPLCMGLDPNTLQAQLSKFGFNLQEWLSPDAIDARYFLGHEDGYRATDHAHFAHLYVQ